MLKHWFVFVLLTVLLFPIVQNSVIVGPGQFKFMPLLVILGVELIVSSAASIAWIIWERSVMTGSLLRATLIVTLIASALYFAVAFVLFRMILWIPISFLTLGIVTLPLALTVGITFPVSAILAFPAKAKKKLP